MKVTDLQVGDAVYAAHDILDDGSMPTANEGDVLASAGTRGVITLIGHVEEQPELTVFLVRFEDKNLQLSDAIGCWEEDLSVDALTA